MELRALLAVALGGAVGAVARYGVGLVALRLWGGPFPVGTWAVNLAGSFLIGLALPTLLEQPVAVRLALVTGFLGAFTTFSAFSLETAALWEAGRPGLALLNAAGSVVLGLAAVGLGLWIGRALA